MINDEYDRPNEDDEIPRKALGINFNKLQIQSMGEEEGQESVLGLMSRTKQQPEVHSSSHDSWEFLFILIITGRLSFSIRRMVNRLLETEDA